MRTPKQALLLGASVATMGAFALFGPAQAADIYEAPPPPVETWTGFSIGGGGGVGIFNTNVEGSAGRLDWLCDITSGGEDCVPFDGLLLEQEFEINDLGDEGGFGTVHLAYDKQVHQRWVLGAFVDADFYGGMKASATEDSFAFELPLGDDDDDDDEAWAFISSKAEMELDWSITVGGRIGKLVTPSTLLYFLAGYTHMELDKAQFSVFTNAAFEPIGEAGPFAGECGEDVFGPCPLSFTIALPDSADGYTLGGGAQMKLHGPWSLKFEYRFTHINYNESGAGEGLGFFCEGESAGDDCRGAEAGGEIEFDDINLHTVRAVLTYSFWTGKSY